MKLSSLTSKFYNKIVVYENSTGYGYKTQLQNASISYIAKFIDSSRSNTSKKINSLIKKGILIEDKEEVIEDKNNRKSSSSALFINPELCYQGPRNSIHGYLCRHIIENDILEKQDIFLPWKVWINENKKNGELYKRGTYLKKRCQPLK